MQFGSASIVKPVIDPETDTLCDEFLRKLGYVGLCEIELKRDSRDGTLKMIEANPRYSGTGDAAPYSGVPLGWLHYLDLIGEAVIPVHPNSRHFHHITLRRDIPTVGSYVAAGINSWREIIRSYRPPVVFFDLSLRDWRLTAQTMGFAVRFILERIYRSVFPKKPRQA
jgi:predicted ATP-grasp superfamily ATP-dependent carboligase